MCFHFSYSDYFTPIKINNRLPDRLLGVHRSHKRRKHSKEGTQHERAAFPVKAAFQGYRSTRPHCKAADKADKVLFRFSAGLAVLRLTPV